MREMKYAPMVLFFLMSLTCVVTSDHMQRKKSCLMMCHLRFLAALATAAPLPEAAEAVANGEAMVVDMMAETVAVAGAYNNQPKSGSNCCKPIILYCTNYTFGFNPYSTRVFLASQAKARC
jgi:hypothetical protein